MYTIASFSGASSPPVTRPLTVRKTGPFCLSGGGGPVLPPLGPGVYCPAANAPSSSNPHTMAKNRLIAPQYYPAFRLDAEKLLPTAHCKYLEILHVETRHAASQNRENRVDADALVWTRTPSSAFFTRNRAI